MRIDCPLGNASRRAHPVCASNCFSRGAKWENCGERITEKKKRKNAKNCVYRIAVRYGSAHAGLMCLCVSAIVSARAKLTTGNWLAAAIGRFCYVFCFPCTTCWLGKLRFARVITHPGNRHVLRNLLRQ